MIEEFSFGNFKSFKDIQTLNMTSAKIKSSNPALDKDNLIPIQDDLFLLKSKVIYGANASGKSNIIKALGSFKKIVLDSVKNEKILRHIYSFQLSTETIKKPTFFQLTFRLNGIKYRYGFEADFESIKSEWLFSTPKKREQPLFIREDNKIININKAHFEEGAKSLDLIDNENDEAIFRENSLFLSSLASFGFGKLSKSIVQYINSILIINGLGSNNMFNRAGSFLENTNNKNFILNFLKKADTGIDDLEVMDFTQDSLPEDIDIDNEIKEKLKNHKFIISHKPIFDKNLKSKSISYLPFAQESEGTLKMFELSPFIYNSLKEGIPLFIDEFDARFHPLLTKKIIELYNSPQNKQSQLVVGTHDTNLLSSELLRRDQIDFVEKDKYGASHLYTLVELKGIRSNASFEKDYIRGKYGAIPYLGDFSELLNFEEDA